MSQDRTPIGYTFTCDCCGELRPAPERRDMRNRIIPMVDAWTMAEADGWAIVEVDKKAPGQTGLEHRCGGCK